MPPLFRKPVKPSKAMFSLALALAVGLTIEFVHLVLLDVLRERASCQPCHAASILAALECISHRDLRNQQALRETRQISNPISVPAADFSQNTRDYGLRAPAALTPAKRLKLSRAGPMVLHASVWELFGKLRINSDRCRHK
jgi:hypothetical protein